MSIDAARCWASLQAIRREAPLVQNITNFVSMDVVANSLLALGASPAMVHAKEEVADFAAIARALVVNIGTLTPPWVEAMVKAAETMTAKNKPWVLDPVGVGATPYRTRTASQLAALGPSVIRANASEILALAGAALGPTKGVDSTHSSDEAIEAADHLARQLGAIVAVTGAVDYVTDGERSLSVGNGHPMMTKVTALGCAASGVVGAFLVVEKDPLAAAAEALSVFGLAAERAANMAEGPGSLRWRLLDQLAALDEAALDDGVCIE
ncbi:MAG: hydroxyethylthiazole kinase [Geminicoccaceae bacterium]